MRGGWALLPALAASSWQGGCRVGCKVGCSFAGGAASAACLPACEARCGHKERGCWAGEPDPPGCFLEGEGLRCMCLLGTDEESFAIVARGAYRFRVEVPSLPHIESWVNFTNLEAPTYAAFDAYVSAGSVALDVGAWIGQTTLYLAKRAARVVALEPTLQAYSALSRNLALNPDLRNRVHVLHAALAPADSLAVVTNFGDSMDNTVRVLRLRGPGAALLGELYPALGYSTWTFRTDNRTVEGALTAVPLNTPECPRTASVVLVFAGDGDAVLVLDPRFEPAAALLEDLHTGRLPPELGAEPAEPLLLGARLPDTAPYTLVEELSAATLLAEAPSLADVGFIKVDTEGAERAIVPALRPLLADGARPVLLVSVHEIYLGEPAARAVVDELEALCGGGLRFASSGEPLVWAQRESRLATDVLCRAGGWE